VPLVRKLRLNGIMKIWMRGSMTKIVACYCLHYGIEWLKWSMRSVEPFVDEIRVYYTPKPSHGYSSNLLCPDSRDELKAIADEFGVIWHDGLYEREGQHRDFAYDDCIKNGADTILVVDADELWKPEDIRTALEYVSVGHQSGYPDHRRWRVNMIHFWKSLNWVCRDNMWPERIIIPSSGNAVEGYIPQHIAQPLHMGYAISDELMRYKISIHGHKAEFRPNWFEEKFLNWNGVGDVHPTCVDTWTPEPFHKNSIYDLVHDHPYFQLESL